MADFESTVKGKENHLYVLTNKNGMEVCVTNFGARIVSIMVPNKNGEMQDVVLGFDSIADYVNNEDNNFGAAIGRYGNRIAQGKITIEGKEYQLLQNNYGHCLHGGPEGYHRQMWDANQVDEHTLEMTLQDSAAVANFPGNVTVKMTYTLTDDNELKIDYSATTDSTTILNLTNHSYFNLGDLSKDVMAQELMISADSITPIDSTFMTNGTMQAVAGTPFDFRKSKPIGKDIKADDEQLKNGNGYDHNFVLNTGGDAQNGWDTDQFPIDNYELTLAMLQIIRNGGLGNGGSNFDAKIRRNSTDLEDLIIAHISGMDAMARALLNAAAIVEKSEIPAMLKQRYASFDAGVGKDFEEGKLTLEQLVDYAKANGEPAIVSGKQEKYETLVALYAK
ncbi:MAG: galactose-1-epimerase [Muribaculaceae bacterium]|nr:galactose-1-epimerase [Muribaculaceae bacterium]